MNRSAACLFNQKKRGTTTTLSAAAACPESRNIAPIISSVDADGVALAAIKGLHQLRQQDAQTIAELQEEVASLKSLVDAMLRKPASTVACDSDYSLPGAAAIKQAGMLTRSY